MAAAAASQYVCMYGNNSYYQEKASNIAYYIWKTTTLALLYVYLFHIYMAAAYNINGMYVYVYV